MKIVKPILSVSIFMLFFSTICIASEVPPIFDQVIEWVNSLFSWAGLIGVATLLEIIFRIFPTEKPKSIAWLIRDIFEKLSKIFELMAKLLDKILPQRVK